MATESDLRSLLRDPDAGASGALDVDAVLRGARRRRRPRVVAAALGGALAASLVVAPVLSIGLPGLGGATVTADAALESAGGGEVDPQSVENDGDRILGEGACGVTSDDATPAVEGLALTLRASPGDQTTPEVRFALSNVGSERLAGFVSANPVVLVEREGVVLAAGGGPLEPEVAFDLAPGESAEFVAPVVLSGCGADDEAAGSAELSIQVTVQLAGRATLAVLESAPIAIDAG